MPFSQKLADERWIKKRKKDAPKHAQDLIKACERDAGSFWDLSYSVSVLADPLLDDEYINGLLTGIDQKVLKGYLEEAELFAKNLKTIIAGLD